MKKYFLALLFGLASLMAQAANVKKIEDYQAPFYVGRTVQVCGKVAQVVHRSQVNFLNLGKAYPNETIALVIWEKDRYRIELRYHRLNSFERKRVCATGTITRFKGKLQLTINDVANIRLAV